MSGRERLRAVAEAAGEENAVLRRAYLDVVEPAERVKLRAREGIEAATAYWERYSYSVLGDEGECWQRVWESLRIWSKTPLRQLRESMKAAFRAYGKDNKHDDEQ